MEFVAHIPALKGFSVAVAGNHFFGEGFVDVYLLLEIALQPVLPRIIQAEVEIHAAAFRFAQKEVHQIQVHRPHGAKFLQGLRRKSGSIPIPRPNENHGVNPAGMHGIEVFAPFLRSPVRGRDVVGNFVEKGTGDGERLHKKWREVVNQTSWTSTAFPCTATAHRSTRG